MSSGVMESLLQVLDWKAFDPTNITVRREVYVYRGRDKEKGEERERERGSEGGREGGREGERERERERERKRKIAVCIVWYLWCG